MAELGAGAGCGGQCADGLAFDFTMAFQPVVDIAARRIYAYEALVRGLNGESAGSILALVNNENRYAFDQACRVKAIQMAAQLGLDRRLNINFMPNAVYHPEACLQLTLTEARRCNFPAELITFEFTEDERIVDRADLKAIVETYRRRGFRTAIDDFGAGYAGLSLLADFQPDVVKVDRFLVTNVDADKARQAIIAGVMTMARALGIDVVAEGVETAAELAVLKDLGITVFQGFLFAHPVIGRLIRDYEIAW